ncbi:helix-turn-helix domain-containing protein [Brevundimonas sp.]|uniref:winged helix-turn-helix transcriptional regulator n=1 Tax=Brevundimonas sp. TaxID=1871086 RepID=UPI002AB8AB91|nr:helix-turn-helix domain-containing protein [Brevundimonas sp.]MDZ4365393.1 helix-turn-helix domain-containing protein [Brevundimonas sp.]
MHKNAPLPQQVTAGIPAPHLNAPDVFAALCPTRQILDRIGDKWTVLVVQVLDEGPMRFNGLKRRISGVSQKMLAQTLRHLERDGLVSRRVFPTTPVTVEYALTPLGQTLVGALTPLIAWSEGRIGDVTAARAVFDAREPVGWT